MKLNLGRDSEARFGLVEILNFKFIRVIVVIVVMAVMVVIVVIIVIVVIVVLKLSVDSKGPTKGPTM